MKWVLFMVLLLSVGHVFSQGKDISLSKKLDVKYVVIDSDTIWVDQEIKVATGSNPDGSFKYVQLLNNFNEPVGPATSRVAMKKQQVKFFKEQDGTTYAFTKFFVMNVEAALKAKEVRID